MAATSSALRLTGSPISLAASSTAVFDNATTSQLTVNSLLYVGTGGAGDSTLTVGPDTSNQWIFGYDETDKSFALASSTALGTSNVFTVAKATLLTTFHNALTVVGNTIVAALTATGVVDFGGATSFEIPNGTGPTVDAVGEIALDTTKNEFLIATSTASGAPAVFKPYRSFGFTFGTSTQGSGTTTKAFVVAPDAGYFDEIVCHTNSFMRVLLKDEAGNRMDDLVASSTEGTVKLTTNNTVTANEVILADVGTTTNIASNVYGTCWTKFYYSRN